MGKIQQNSYYLITILDIIVLSKRDIVGFYSYVELIQGISYTNPEFNNIHTHTNTQKFSYILLVGLVV